MHSAARYGGSRYFARRAVNVVAILHSRAVAFSTRHRLQDQSVADCVRHCAVHRRRDTLGSDRQRARRVRSTVLRGCGGASSALIAPAGLIGAAIGVLDHGGDPCRWRHHSSRSPSFAFASLNFILKTINPCWAARRRWCGRSSPCPMPSACSSGGGGVTLQTVCRVKAVNSSCNLGKADSAPLPAPRSRTRTPPAPPAEIRFIGHMAWRKRCDRAFASWSLF
jgi:hypothetical protein